MRKNTTRPSRRRARRRGKRRRGLIPIIKHSCARLRGKLLKSPLVPIIGGLALSLIILVAVAWYFTHKNAYDVYVGDEWVASIPRTKEITSTWIYDNALAKLTSDIGAAAQVDVEVSIVPVNKSSSKLSPVDYAIGAVYKAFSETGYKLEASEVIVNGVPIVLLRNSSEVKTAFDTVMRSYAPEDAEIVEMDWVDDKVEVVSKFVESDSLESIEVAVSKLTATTEVQSTYVVRSGDSIWQIGKQFGLSQERLVELNPGVPEIASGNIRIDQMVNVVTFKPLCSVRTVEKIVYSDIEKRPVEERPNAAQPRGYTKLVQQGKDGEREVTAHLVRINGVETERIEVSSEILVNPVVEIVEVGAG